MRISSLIVPLVAASEKCPTGWGDDTANCYPQDATLECLPLGFKLTGLTKTVMYETVEAGKTYGINANGKNVGNFDESGAVTIDQQWDDIPNLKVTHETNTLKFKVDIHGDDPVMKIGDLTIFAGKKSVAFTIVCPYSDTLTIDIDPVEVNTEEENNETGSQSRGEMDDSKTKPQEWSGKDVFDLSVYSDAEYKTKVTTKAPIEVGSRVYNQIQPKLPAALQFFVASCEAKASKEADEKKKISIFQNYECYNPFFGDAKTIFGGRSLKTGSKTDYKFSFPAFAFSAGKNQQLHMTCRITMCPADDDCVESSYSNRRGVDDTSCEKFKAGYKANVAGNGDGESEGTEEKTEEKTDSNVVINLRAGGVIDGLYIEKGTSNKAFGFCGTWEKCKSEGSSMSKVIELATDEVMQSIKYGRMSSGNYQGKPCKLSFITNKKTYGPYSTDAKCTEPKFNVDIPSGTALFDFFNDNVKTKENFFDGFKTEKNTDAPMIINLKAGAVVDGIYIEKGTSSKVFGACSDPWEKCKNAANENMSKVINLAADEVVKSIKYARMSGGDYKDRTCKLSLTTNKKTYGPYSTHAAHCGEPTYTVDIPADTPLIDFFNGKVKTADNRFDGFTTEKNTGGGTTSDAGNSKPAVKPPKPPAPRPPHGHHHHRG